MKKVDTFEELLRSVGKRPGFFLAPDLKSGNSRSIRELSSFIAGIQVGQHLKNDSSILDEFSFWVCSSYGIPMGSSSWYGHISERAGGDDAVAFRLFFEHFDEYVREREKIGPEAIKARYLATCEKRAKRKNKSI